MNVLKNHLWTILCLLLCVLPMFSCGDDAVPAGADTHSGQTDLGLVSEEQTVPRETETDAAMTVTAAAETETETGKAVSPTTEAPIPAEPQFRDPLTGLECPEEEAARRPAAIMLNNLAAALPQQNIGAADILYECEVEGGITRLMGVYNDYADLVGIGSIRSSREYYIDFAANHDAVYVHAGGSDEAYRNLKSRGIDNIDGVNGGAVTAYFYRDPVRRQTMSLEHTLVIDGKKLDEAITLKKYRTTVSESFENPMQFTDIGKRISFANGRKAESFTVKFGASSAAFVYDKTSNTYLRSQNGKPHIDGVTGEQLAFENVLILVCPYNQTYDDKNHITVTDTGTGTGYYVTGGRYLSVCWSKETPDTPFTLTYSDGSSVRFTPGKTNIEIVGYTDRVIFDK